MALVNGQAAKLVNSSPADASEYSLSNTGGTTRITRELRLSRATRSKAGPR